MQKRKYEGWGEFLKNKRQVKYRSAREFCSKADIGISYPQYSRYEAGDQLPSLDQALVLCRLLDIPLLEGLLEWNRTQVQDGSIRSELDVLLDKTRKPTAGVGVSEEGQVPENSAGGIGLFTRNAVPLDDVIVFNRSHLKLFTSDLRFRDIFTYVNSYAPEWISMDEISEALNIKKSELGDMLDQLNDLGVLLVAGSRCRASKRNFYFPDDPDFFELRNQNIIQNVTDVLKKISHDDLINRKAYRAVLSRELTDDQVEWLVGKIDELLGKTVGLPESPNPQNIFSFCLLMGKRFTRPEYAMTGVTPGLTSQVGQVGKNLGGKTVAINEAINDKKAGA